MGDRVNEYVDEDLDVMVVVISKLMLHFVHFVYLYQISLVSKGTKKYLWVVRDSVGDWSGMAFTMVVIDSLSDL